jgi:hypothetical protein
MHIKYLVNVDFCCYISSTQKYANAWHYLQFFYEQIAHTSLFLILSKKNLYSIVIKS